MTIQRLAGVEAVLEEGTLGGYLRAQAGAGGGDQRPALIVQGGGMRAIYSMAALAVLEELGLRDAFSMVLSSSAGVLNSAYFLAGQAREAVSIYVEGLSNRTFIRPWRVWKVIDVDHMVDVTLKQRHPLDHGELIAAPASLHAVLADAETAEPKVIEHVESGFDIYEIFRATTAIPLLYNRKVRLGDRSYVDGGIADLIPLEVARGLGAKEAVLLLTRGRGQRKFTSGRMIRTVTDTAPFRQSTAVRVRLYEEDPAYNRTMEELEAEHEHSVRTTWTLWPTDLARLVNRGTIDPARLRDSAALAETDVLALLRQPYPGRQTDGTEEPG